MTFSILASEPLSLARTAPDFFVDLNLDQIVSTVTAGHGQYDLAAYFHTPLHSVDAVHYRHEVVRDLEQPSLRAKVYDFAKQMAAVRDNLKTAEKLHYKYQKEALFRDAVETYCAAVVDSPAASATRAFPRVGSSAWGSSSRPTLPPTRSSH